jgi:heat shock protein HtpX
MMQKISFFDQISRNKRNSYILILLIFFSIIGLGWVFAQIYDPGAYFIILIFSIIFSLAYTVGTYYYSDKLALMSVNAYPADSPQFRQYRNRVEGLALAAGLPTPKVYVMNTPEINAFATGRDPQHSVICVTTGTLQNLTDAELEGVLAHEMSHIANYDIRFVTLAAIMVGIVSIASEIFLRSMWFGGGRDRDNKGSGGAIFLVIGIVIAIFAPIFVKLVQLAISRKREYMADAGSVQLTRAPPYLVSALKKIKMYYEGGGARVKVNDAVAPMFFADPIKSRFIGLFNTHPPIDDRIKALEKMM